MDKKEILRKAQLKKPNQLDEREQQVELVGYEMAFWGGLLVCLILMVIKMAVGLPWQDVYCVYTALAGIHEIYKWRKLESKHWFSGVCWCFTSLLLFITYLSKIL